MEPEKNWYGQSYLQSRNRDTGVVQEGQETQDKLGDWD